jgi:predicted DNA-binding transcriptional regulator AlpA
MDSVEGAFDVDILTTEEASRLTHVKEGTLRYWRATRQGPPWFKLGPRKIAYRRSQVEAWMREQYDASAVDPKAGKPPSRPTTPPATPRRLAPKARRK